MDSAYIFNLNSYLSRMEIQKMIEKILKFLRDYKNEVVFTFALILLCFSIAIWAIAMNAVKYQNVIGTY